MDKTIIYKILMEAIEATSNVNYGEDEYEPPPKLLFRGLDSMFYDGDNKLTIVFDNGDSYLIKIEEK